MSDRERPGDDNGSGKSGGGGGGEVGEGSSEKCNGFGEKGKKGKKAHLFRLRKGKKILERKRKPKGIAVNSCCLWGCCGGGGGGRRGGGGRCCFSSKPVESASESPTSDPNSPDFTFDMLRTLIEKNDFYATECNPHLDADD